MYIGSTPCDEACAQTGREDAPRLQRIECEAYIAALKRVHGEPPEGARLVSRSMAHDLGSYREVHCLYDSDNEEAAAYACKVEEGLRTWEEAGFWRPVTYDDRNNAVDVISDPGLWLKETNPEAHPTRELRDAAAAAKET